MRSGIAASLFLLIAALSAHAQAPDALTGTLRRVRDSGQIVVGYRRDALPFSYADQRGAPVGYGIDLCREIVADAMTFLGDTEISIVYQPVSTTDQLVRLTGGGIDLDCGAITNTAERRRMVAFSPTIFVSGGRLLVARTSPIRVLRDIAGHTIVTVAGSTTATAIQHFIALQKLDARLVGEPDVGQAFRRLTSGGADALATNDVLLYSLIATAEGGRNFHVVGGLLTFAPYAIAYRRDDAGLAAVVGATFARLANQTLLTDLYNRWFIHRLPTGERLEVPMSPQLREVFRGLGEPG